MTLCLVLLPVGVALIVIGLLDSGNGDENTRGFGIGGLGLMLAASGAIFGKFWLTGPFPKRSAAAINDDTEDGI